MNKFSELTLSASLQSNLTRNGFVQPMVDAELHRGLDRFDSVLLDAPFYSDPDLLRSGLTDWAVEFGRPK